MFLNINLIRHLNNNFIAILMLLLLLLVLLCVTNFLLQLILLFLLLLISFITHIQNKERERKGQNNIRILCMRMYEKKAKSSVQTVFVYGYNTICGFGLKCVSEAVT